VLVKSAKDHTPQQVQHLLPISGFKGSKGKDREQGDVKYNISVAISWCPRCHLGPASRGTPASRYASIGTSLKTGATCWCAWLHIVTSKTISDYDFRFLGSSSSNETSRKISILTESILVGFGVGTESAWAFSRFAWARMKALETDAGVHIATIARAPSSLSTCCSTGRRATGFAALRK
jgi:hypothetical protein